jgi:hypothetical protein
LGIRTTFKDWSAQKAHFSSWLLKDAFWCLKLKWFATFMVIPTTILTLYLLFKEKDNLDTNFIVSSWVFMNIFWMLHELHGFPFFMIIIFMVLGLLSVFRMLLK